MLHVLAAGGREPICSNAPVRGGDTPLCFHPSCFQHPLQRWIKRAFLDLQQFIGCLLDVLGQSVAVQGLALEGLENHHLERAGKKIALVLSFHSAILTRHYLNSHRVNRGTYSMDSLMGKLLAVTAFGSGD